MKSLFLGLFFTLFVAIGAQSLFAAVPKVVQASSIFSNSSTSKIPTSTMALGIAHPLRMNVEAAKATFAGSVQQLELLGFPLLSSNVALQLQRTIPVADGRTIFERGSKNGLRRYTVEPVFSWAGTVDGDPESMVSLHYTSNDITGFIQTGSGVRYIITENSMDKSTTKERALVVANERGAENVNPLAQFFCGSTDPSIPQSVLDNETIERMKQAERPQATGLLELEGAFVLRDDIDSIARARGISPERTTEYFVKIVAAMSQAYERDLNCHLHINYFLMHNEDNPSDYFWDGTEPGRLLGEFAADWSRSKSSIQRDFAHIYTYKRPVGGLFVGGIAYGGGRNPNLCDNARGGSYGVSTVDFNLNSVIPGNPNFAAGFVWDVFVGAHEIGHNIGAPHTHSCSWNPPVDSCQLQNDGTDACYNVESLRRIRPGTIMSYCHLVNGSTTPLSFGTRPSADMRRWLEQSSCISTISGPQIFITDPRGAFEFRVGSMQQIAWASNGVSTVNIEYQPTLDGPWIAIASGVNAADRQYNWNVPSIDASSLAIRVMDAGGSAAGDTTLARYTVRTALALQQPVGGERIAAGTTFNIIFTKQSSVSGVNVEFSSNNGSTWEPVATNTSATTVTWTVPEISTNEALIRINGVGVASASSQSSAFAIGPRTFTLLSPVVGDSICKNSENLFRWSGDFLPPTMRIQYSFDGSAFRSLLTPTSIPSSPSEVRDVPTNNTWRNLPGRFTVRVRITGIDTNEVLASIPELLVYTCETSVTEESALAGYVIQSIAPNPAHSHIAAVVSMPIESAVTVAVVSTLGVETQLSATMQPLGNGEYSISIPTINVAQGQYQLLLRTRNYVMAAPFSIVR
jgi:hypothetical protein